ncbi:aldehyde dehydrogenase family protein [Halomicroarcula sp. GCM10025324]|uniref:aldehyde dehydrogenase family protein n=1 Tax=Haloarcula TaxID=2237 RepID=UPI0023E85C55|nr:aldehyde dehydrogenase family protein [Halomicroarcula sp. ZS-22-S1]
MSSDSTVDRQEKYQLFVDGEHVDAENNGTFDVNDPATTDVIAEVARGREADIEYAVDAANAALDDWRRTNPKARSETLRDIAVALRANVETLAQLTTLENGKPISEARGEAEGCADAFDFYAGIADKVHGEQIPRGREYVDFTYREPLGVTAHIAPWNFPLSIFARSVAVALATGNTAVVKPAEQTPLGALTIAKIAHEAGLPDGALNVVTGFGAEAGAPLAGHPNIDCVTFTGSVETGRKVAELAAQQITPANLELGGKGPNVVFPDADMDLALDNAVAGLFTMVSGQCCSAGSRLLVHEDIYDEFLDNLADRLDALEVGPGSEDPDMGPMIDEGQYEKVKSYLDVGRKEVGEPFYGGEVLDREGYFIGPTVFAGASNDSRLAQEEIFGPILPAISFSDEQEAIEKANDTEFGLTAGIFTADLNRAHRFARDVEAGGVYINEWFAEGIETPFGGFKKSGIGREKSTEAVKHYTQSKNVCANIGIGE